MPELHPLEQTEIAPPRRLSGSLETLIETTGKLKHSRQVRGVELMEQLSDWTTTGLITGSSRLAARIRQWLDDGEMLEAKGRPVRAGDIMVLVRRRTRFKGTRRTNIKEGNGRPLRVRCATRWISTGKASSSRPER